MARCDKKDECEKATDECNKLSHPFMNLKLSCYRAKGGNSAGSNAAPGSVTDLAELKDYMERGFRALHLEVASSICNDLRNSVYAVINCLEDKE